MVTEYLEYGNVRNLMRKRNLNLPWKFRAKMLMDAARAMAYLHSRGIVHCNLKTSNLMLDASKTVKVSDLSLSRKVGDFLIHNVGSTEWRGMCVMHAVLCIDRIPWVSSEVLTSKEPVDGRYVDVFCFGLVRTVMMMMMMYR